MKYIHVDGDVGTTCVLDAVDADWYGWVYQVPDDYELRLTLSQLTSHKSYVYEHLSEDPKAILVKKH